MFDLTGRSVVIRLLLAALGYLFIALVQFLLAVGIIAFAIVLAYKVVTGEW